MLVCAKVKLDEAGAGGVIKREASPGRGARSNMFYWYITLTGVCLVE